MTRRFGPEFRRMRLEKGKSMGDVARLLKVSVPYVSDVERGFRGPFDRHKLAQIAADWGTPSSHLEALAAQDRQTVQVDLGSASARQAEVAVALARQFQDLSEADLESLMAVLAGRGHG